jgi:hypothetical protein
MTQKINARELRQRVAAKFGRENRWSDAVVLPVHVVLFEVPLMGRMVEDRYGNPLRSRQRIDVVAIGVWGKTDNLVHGFEVKVSRADLMAELRDLSKSEYAARACDRWWLVVAAGILRDDDPVPESWGILEQRGRGLTIRREPTPQLGETGRLVGGIATRALAAPTYGRALAYRRGFDYARNVYEKRY